MAKEKQYFTCIAIVAGIITLIDADGAIREYRQRGIENFDEKLIFVLQNLGMLDPKWRMYEVLPDNIRLCYEDEYLMGKARAFYPKVELIVEQLRTFCQTPPKK